MNKDETLKLFAQGREAWNEWAKEMLARRAEMEAAGQWKASRDKFGLEQATNHATTVWFDKARADFADYVFKEDADFTGFSFPHNANFTGSSFKGRTVFHRAKFEGDAIFESATFCRSAEFGGKKNAKNRHSSEAY